MARQKSELLSAVGTVFEIVKAIVDEVLNLGGNDKDLRRILKDRNLRKQIAELLVKADFTDSAVTQTFKVCVDYGKTLAEMIASGHYDTVCATFTQEHFPVNPTGKKGQEEVEIVLFPKGNRSIPEVIAELESRDYRSARIEELLALGATYPELQEEFMIMALGSPIQKDRADINALFFPCLASSFTSVGRLLGFYWLGNSPKESTRFAAVHK